jgi:hypothetical protein
MKSDGSFRLGSSDGSLYKVGGYTNSLVGTGVGDTVVVNGGVSEKVRLVHKAAYALWPYCPSGLDMALLFKEYVVYVILAGSSVDAWLKGGP